MGGRLPAGVSLHATKVLRRGPSLPERVEGMAGRLLEARDALLDSRVDAIAYGCMVSCLVKGPAWSEKVGASLGTSEVPFATASSALVAALAALPARRVSVFSPYARPVVEGIPRYFAECGVEVVANVTREELGDPHVVVTTHPEDLFRDIVRLPKAEALCILSTDLATFQVLEALEATREAPVVTSNQAMLWWLLRASGVGGPVAGLGALGQRPGAAAGPTA
jgi:maleate isomerase